MLAGRSLLACAVVLGLVGFGHTADEAKKAKKKNAAGAVTAVVKEVQADKEKPETGTLNVLTTIRVKKGEVAPPGEAKKFTITADTKIESAAAAKKGEAPVTTAAKLADLKTDANIVVTLKEGSTTEAAKIQIVAGKKAK